MESVYVCGTQWNVKDNFNKCVSFEGKFFNLQMSDELLTNEPANQLTYHNVLSSECCRQLITFGHK